MVAAGGGRSVARRPVPVVGIRLIAVRIGIGHPVVGRLVIGRLVGGLIGRMVRLRMARHRIDRWVSKSPSVVAGTHLGSSEIAKF